MHERSGRPLSRSAVHADPEALHDLASRVAGLAVWTDEELAVPGPRLRAELARAVGEWRDAQGVDARSEVIDALPPPAAALRSAPIRRPTLDQDDPDRLRRLIRHLYGAIPPGLLGATVREIDVRDRDVLLAVLAEENGDDTTGVIQAIRPASDAPTVAVPVTDAAAPTMSVPATAAVLPPTGPEGAPRRGTGGPGRAAG